MKFLKIITVFVLLTALFLTGCSSEEPLPANQVMEEVQNMIDNPMAEEVPEPEMQIEERNYDGTCVLLRDCPSNSVLCFFGKCWTESDIYSSFTKCNMMQCDQPCENCEKTREQCLGLTSAGSPKMYNVCADCLNDEHCDPSFKCETGRCV
ncbi:MAG: hypothetical protein L6266_03620 [Nanoarchaeota archaeon]|nr:hypothetical protein [Nanoarchaeota archaeon]